MIRAERKYKKFKHWVRAIIALTIIALIGVGIFYYIKKTVKPAIIEASVVTVRSLGTNIINNSAKSALTLGVNYDDMFTVEKDSGGKIKAVKSNALALNTILRQIAEIAQKDLDKMGTQDITLPLGTISGLVLLTGFGPDVTIKITPIGAVQCEYISIFESAGINQTLHRLYINVTANIKIITPVDDAQTTVGTEFLLCEHMIIGEVPETYLNIGRLDLLP